MWETISDQRPEAKKEMTLSKKPKVLKKEMTLIELRLKREDDGEWREKLEWVHYLLSSVIRDQIHWNCHQVRPCKIRNIPYPKS
jgi:lipopolysaccharide biosynthesis regulator YciM